MKKFWNKVKRFFSHKCPKCGGCMTVWYAGMVDPNLNVYECDECGTEWICL